MNISYDLLLDKKKMDWIRKFALEYPREYVLALNAKSREMKAERAAQLDRFSQNPKQNYWKRFYEFMQYDPKELRADFSRMGMSFGSYYGVPVLDIEKRIRRSKTLYTTKNGREKNRGWSSYQVYQSPSDADVVYVTFGNDNDGGWGSSDIEPPIDMLRINLDRLSVSEVPYSVLGLRALPAMPTRSADGTTFYFVGSQNEIISKVSINDLPFITSNRLISSQCMQCHTTSRPLYQEVGSPYNIFCSANCQQNFHLPVH